jgi:hypothetical protein
MAKTDQMVFVQLYAEYLSIFEQNPGLKNIKPLDELYKKGEEGDKIMKAIYFIYDLKSPYYSFSPKEEDRIQEVNTGFLEVETFDWKQYKEYTDFFKKHCRTELQKQLDIFRKDIQGRETFFRSLSWTDPVERVEKDILLTSHDKFIEKYAELKGKVESEIEELESLGGYRKSWLEAKSLESRRSIDEK